MPLATNTVVVGFEQLAANILQTGVDVILLSDYRGGVVSSATLEAARASRVPCAATYVSGAIPLAISHCARLAFRLPVTGASKPDPSPISARTSNCASWPAACAPTTPSLMPRSAAQSGCNASTASADVLEIHPHDAELRGIKDGDLVGLTSRSGEIVLPADVTDRVRPGVVYTTFHFPESGANVVTTENSDWATNCPEYKVTAVEIVKVNHPSEWQKRFHEFTEHQLELLKGREATHA